MADLLEVPPLDYPKEKTSTNEGATSAEEGPFGVRPKGGLASYVGAGSLSELFRAFARELKKGVKQNLAK
jgi:hypothetical protein